MQEIENNEQHVIKYNVNLLQWYFKKNKKVLEEKEKEYIFSLMSYSFLEDHYCFMRILLYIANTRKTDEQEITYKIIIHFLCIMFPDIVMANIDMFLNLGKKDDVIYFLQCSNMSAMILKYVNHKAKQDDDFKILLTGELIKKNQSVFIKYKPKFKSKLVWTVFLNQLLDDPILNGITL
jgi:hypothetical protein